MTWGDGGVTENSKVGQIGRDGIIPPKSAARILLVFVK